MTGPIFQHNYNWATCCKLEEKDFGARRKRDGGMRERTEGVGGMEERKEDDVGE